MHSVNTTENCSRESLYTAYKRFCIAVVFSIAFAYIESAVVVYLREIFYTDGFSFPLVLDSAEPLWRRLVLTEIGREAATMVLILTSAALFGQNLRQRVAYFLAIFAVWDIFYYVWLKVLLDWPASIMEWDILFLIPVVWASPVLAPILVSIAMLLFAIIIIHRDCIGRVVETNFLDWLGFMLSGLIIIVSFTIAGVHSADDNYQDYFCWWLFLPGLLFGIAVFIKCLIKSGHKP